MVRSGTVDRNENEGVNREPCAASHLRLVDHPDSPGSWVTDLQVQVPGLEFCRSLAEVPAENRDTATAAASITQRSARAPFEVRLVQVNSARLFLQINKNIKESFVFPGPHPAESNQRNVRDPCGR